MRSTPAADLDRALATLTEHKARWPSVSLSDRIAALRGCIGGVVAVADEMARAGCRAKGLDPDSPAGAEEWFSGPIPIVRNLRLLAATLRDIERTGRPRLAGTAEGRARVFPLDRFDRVLYPGVTVDVWIDSPTPRFIEPDTRGGVALVLGAGNVASIGVMDLLYKLFVENRVVILKMHPINDYLGPFIERAFEPLISAGFVRVVYGDADVGEYLVAHPEVDEIHITGSVAVHNIIAAATTKPITSELGCVTPVIAVPGNWREEELTYQAENVATMVALNASCNCNAAKLMVTWKGWPQRQAFLDRVGRLLSGLPPRLAYYPGSAAKYARFLEGRAPVLAAATAGPGPLLPFVLLRDVNPRDHQDVVFTEEAWSPIVAETALAAADAAQFLSEAVRFCNSRVFGTLSAVVLVDPRARVALGEVFARAIADLRYGTVAINQWSAMSYVLAAAPWGAYPGHTREDPGSGIGVVHNTQMLAGVIKSVLDSPFTSSRKPPWFITHPRSHVVARQMVRFEAEPSWWRLPALAWAARD